MAGRIVIGLLYFFFFPRVWLPEFDSCRLELQEFEQALQAS